MRAAKSVHVYERLSITDKESKEARSIIEDRMKKPVLLPVDEPTPGDLNNYSANVGTVNKSWD